MRESLSSGTWRIATVMGIPIRLHFSWLIVFGLITWSLSTYYFPMAAPDLPASAYWVKGILAALLLFGSVAFHELAHSFVAQQYKVHIDSITLFIFGGVAQMAGEPPHPKAEFRIAVAGPLSSFFLAVVFFILGGFTSGSAASLFSYVARINLLIALFNLIPGFPMDGGRVVRSALWAKTRNLYYATRQASRIGRGIALFMIVLGVLSLFTGAPGGIWMILIGWFLHSAAQASYSQSTIQASLSGVKVRDVMVKEIVSLDARMSIEEAVDGYFLRYGFGGFPVMDQGRFVGMFTLRETTAVPREEWASTTVSQAYVPHDGRWEVSPDEDALKALELMVREDKGRIAVTENGRLVGLITRNGIARYMQIKGTDHGLETA